MKIRGFGNVFLNAYLVSLCRITLEDLSLLTQTLMLLLFSDESGRETGA